MPNKHLPGGLGAATNPPSRADRTLQTQRPTPSPGGGEGRVDDSDGWIRGQGASIVECHRIGRSGFLVPRNAPDAAAKFAVAQPRTDSLNWRPRPVRLSPGGAEPPESSCHAAA